MGDTQLPIGMQHRLWSDVRKGMSVEIEEGLAPRKVGEIDNKSSDREVYVTFIDEDGLSGGHHYAANSAVRVVSDDLSMRQAVVGNEFFPENFRENSFFAAEDALKNILALRRVLDRRVIKRGEDQDAVIIGIKSEWDQLKKFMEGAGF